MNKSSTGRKQTVVADVYDILNCGPRARFMANGFLVHNSGAEKMNIQNFSRGGALRQSLCLPEGWTMMACDLSQIEARVNAYVAGQRDTIQQFRDKKDIYCEFGSKMYSRTITKADKEERRIAKCAVLGLGYGMGAPKFKDYAKLSGVDISADESSRVVGLYRSVHSNIKETWNICDRVLSDMVAGREGCIRNLLPYNHRGIKLPNGMYIRYPLLRPIPDGKRGYMYVNEPRAYRAVNEGNDNVRWTYVFGAKVVENYVQALARIIVTDMMAVVAKRYKILFQVHDEIVIACKDNEIQEANDFLTSVMSTPPTWAPDMPVDCECSWGKNYKECK